MQEPKIDSSGSDVAVDAIISRTRVALARMTEQRRRVGFDPLDMGSNAVNIIRYAIEMADTIHNPRSIARANLWGGIAAYYNDNTESAYAHFEAAALYQEFLDRGERDDLGQWLDDTRNNKTSVDKRREAYIGHPNVQRGSLASSSGGGNVGGDLQSDKTYRKKSNNPSGPGHIMKEVQGQ
jgi:hypothetical protein